MKAKIYNQTGKESGEVTLSDDVFALPWNADLVHQVVVSMQANARTPVAHTKDRSEVSGGGKKPWKQKGTGRARHGSIRSPLWRTGGVTFGPRNEKDYSKKINKKMRVKALYTVLSEKLRNNEVLFVDSLSFAEPKTKEAKSVLAGLATIKGAESLANKKNSAAFLALGQKNENAARSFNNFSNIEVSTVADMSPVALMNHKYVIITDPKESVAFIEGKMAAKKERRVKETADKK